MLFFDLNAMRAYINIALTAKHKCLLAIVFRQKGYIVHNLYSFSSILCQQTHKDYWIDNQIRCDVKNISKYLAISIPRLFKYETFHDLCVVLSMVRYWNIEICCGRLRDGGKSGAVLVGRAIDEFNAKYS